MKKRVTRSWIPFWGDKWLFGSMRQEFSAAERGIWWDLMAMAMKDEGYIRANEDFPYPIEQLAGFFLVPKDELQKAIDKFVKAKKLTRDEKGILYITNWKKYCFTDRHMRRLGLEPEDEMSAEEDTIAETEDTEGTVADTIKEKKRREEKRKEENIMLEKEFKIFWEIYGVRVAKPDALKAFKALRRKGVEFKTIKEAIKGYANHLKNETWKKQMYPASFLRSERWKDFIGVTHEPSL